MSFLFRDSRAYMEDAEEPGAQLFLEANTAGPHLQGLLQGGQGLVQVLLGVGSHFFTLQLLSPDLLSVLTHHLNVTDGQKRSTAAFRSLRSRRLSLMLA